MVSKSTLVACIGVIATVGLFVLLAEDYVVLGLKESEAKSKALTDCRLEVANLTTLQSNAYEKFESIGGEFESVKADLQKLRRSAETLEKQNKLLIEQSIEAAKQTQQQERNFAKCKGELLEVEAEMVKLNRSTANAPNTLSAAAAPNPQGSKYFLLVMQSARIGSTFFANGLSNLCDDIEMRGELLGNYRFPSRSRTYTRKPALRSWLQSVREYESDDKVKGIGFKTMWADIQDGLPIIQELQPKIIFLQRRNRVKKAISFTRAKQLAAWHSNAAMDAKCADAATAKAKGVGCPEFAFRIDLSVFDSHMDSFEWWDWNAQEYVMRNFRSMQQLHLYYEDIIDNPHEALATMAEFLGSRKCAAHFRESEELPLKKLTPDDVSSAILNYDELESHVRSKYSPIYMDMLQLKSSVDTPLYIPVRRESDKKYLFTKPTRVQRTRNVVGPQ